MSDLGNLSQCMVDSDAAANGRARRLRGKALVASISLEAVVIAGVLLWPLVTLGVLTPQLVLTPIPPYRGEQNPRPAAHRPSEPPVTDRRNAAARALFQPPRIPSHVADTPDPEPPGIDTGGDPSAQLVPSVGIPGGNETGREIEIPRPETKSKPRMVSLGLMDASLVHRVQPEYPRIAKLTRLSGTVLLRALIGTDGEVHEIEVLSGNPILAEAARAAVRQWRYRTTLLHGQAVEVETQITVNFVLD
jgi:periplasmic protein TonB